MKFKRKINPHTHLFLCVRVCTRKQYIRLLSLIVSLSRHQSVSFTKCLHFAETFFVCVSRTDLNGKVFFGLLIS